VQGTRGRELRVGFGVDHTKARLAFFRAFTAKWENEFLLVNR
jgi:hypothetical protein